MAVNLRARIHILPSRRNELRRADGGKGKTSGLPVSVFFLFSDRRGVPDHRLTILRFAKTLPRKCNCPFRLLPSVVVVAKASTSSGRAGTDFVEAEGYGAGGGAVTDLD